MNMHVTTGRWRFGLSLALVTTVLWGLLPVALKGLLDRMDAYTIVWYRLFVSAVVLFLFIAGRHGAPSPRHLRTPVIYILVICALSLCGNYIFYILGLDRVTPSASSIVIQLSSLFMLLGSFIIFKERFSRMQWTGFFILVTGLMLFFNDRIDELISGITNYTSGVLFIVLAALSWAVYALTQKQLLRSFPSEKIMLFIYFTGAMFFLPFAHPLQLVKLDLTGLLLLGFCSFNTLFAYGSFAEAQDHWESSRIVMITATTPLVTVAGMKICSTFFPGFLSPEHLNSLSLLGALLVVSGSMMSSIRGGNNRR